MEFKKKKNRQIKCRSWKDFTKEMLVWYHDPVWSWWGVMEESCGCNDSDVRDLSLSSLLSWRHVGFFLTQSFFLPGTKNMISIRQDHRRDSLHQFFLSRTTEADCEILAECLFKDFFLLHCLLMCFWVCMNPISPGCWGWSFLSPLSSPLWFSSLTSEPPSTCSSKETKSLINVAESHIHLS